MQTSNGGNLIVVADRLDTPIGKGSPTKATYSACILDLAVVASATDIFVINGAAGKTIKVLAIAVSGVATAAGTYDVALVKRSTADTLGTHSAPTIVPLDSADAAAAATVLAYTANPTLGTGVGTIAVDRLTVNTAASSAIADNPAQFLFGNSEGKECVLRGVAEGLAVNLNGVTITGGLLSISALWTEE